MATAADAEADVVGGYNVVSQWTDTLYRPSRAGGGGRIGPRPSANNFTFIIAGRPRYTLLQQQQIGNGSEHRGFLVCRQK